jgi:hypothetical protein
MLWFLVIPTKMTSSALQNILPEGEAEGEVRKEVIRIASASSNLKHPSED